MKFTTVIRGTVAGLMLVGMSGAALATPAGAATTRCWYASQTMKTGLGPATFRLTAKLGFCQDGTKITQYRTYAYADTKAGIGFGLPKKCSAEKASLYTYNGHVNGGVHYHIAAYFRGPGVNHGEITSYVVTADIYGHYDATAHFDKDVNWSYKVTPTLPPC